jgi:hypothetical protein
MAKVKLVTPIRLDKMTLLLKVGSVKVYFHWTVFALSIFMLTGALEKPLTTSVALLSWISVMFIHEIGHMVAAQRLGCVVEKIEMYPIFAKTYFETPWTRFDHCIIAWAGVIAQMVFAVPLVVYEVKFGYPGIEPLDAVIAILGFLSILIAIFNLLPMRGLDGAMAWQLLPALFQRRRAIGKTRF